MRQLCLQFAWLIGLYCLDSTSKKVLAVYLPQLEVDVTEDGDFCNEWIMGTTSNAAGNMQPVKVSANLVFHNFNKLACLYTDFPRSMKGKQIKKIPSNDNVIPLHGDGPLHMVSLPSAILVLYAHRLQSDHPNWVDPDAAVSPRASKPLHAAACAQSVASIQDAS
eukprot:2257108-Ditylum_brightwellii.AAC.1